MNNKMKPVSSSLLCLAVAAAMPASAAITLYDKDSTSFSVDGSFNTFFVQSDSDNDIAGTNRTQSRVKMGLLPNWIGFNFSKQVGDLKLGGRSSFWVSINDSNTNITSTAIDVRQFYGTVDGDWGQILVGKDFTLFSRSNIFLDEMLAGYGGVSDTLGLIDGQGVSFGHIGSGYYYPFPHSQITYRSPDMGGFKVALGIVDPGNTAPTDRGAGRSSEESTPRFEGEFTYHTNFDNGAFDAWVGFLTQETESDIDGDVKSSGVSYGAKVKVGGLAVHASGFTGEGLGLLLGPGADAGLGLTGLISENGDEVDSDGYIVQGSYTMGKSRFVVSYGETEVDTEAEWVGETTQVAWFYSVNSNLTLVTEFNTNEISIGSAAEETDTLALGVIVNF